MEQLENMMEIYHLIYIVCLFAMLLFLVITVILFIKWRVWEAVGILSGKTAVKAINSGHVKKHHKKKKSKELKIINVNPEVETEKLWYREAHQDNSTVVLSMEQGEHFGATEHLEDEEKMIDCGIIILDEVIGVNSLERI